MTTDELRAKFEAYRKLLESQGYCWSEMEWSSHFSTWQSSYASRDTEIGELREDAERYRWLRSRVAGTDRKPFICIFHGNFSLWNGEHADCEIDTAMREESK